MKIRADLHNHLRTLTREPFYEGDFNGAIDLASKRLGENGLVGLVNFTDFNYEAFFNAKGYERVPLGSNVEGFHVPKKNIIVIKGQEVPTKQGHLLVLGLGYGVALKEGRSLEDSLKEARDSNGIAIIDHPFYLDGAGPFLSLNADLIGRYGVSALETHNGEAALWLPFTGLPKGANKDAQSFYSLIKTIFPKLGALSASDGHSLYELGSSWTEIDSPDIKNKANFVQSLRAAIESTDINTPKRMKNSYAGAFAHGIELKLFRLFGNH